MVNMVSSFFNPDEAYEAGQQKANQGWKQAQSFLNPYNQQGQAQYSTLNTAAGKLMDPAALQNEWSKLYEISPYAQQMLKQNQAKGLDAASSMGLGGSSAAIGNIQTGANTIMQEDRQKYMNDLMQKYLAGIGLGQSMYGTGASAANSLAGYGMQNAENQAALEVNRQLAPGQMFGNMLSGGIVGGMTGFNPNMMLQGGAGGGGGSIPPYAAALA